MVPDFEALEAWAKPRDPFEPRGAPAEAEGPGHYGSEVDALTDELASSRRSRRSRSSRRVHPGVGGADPDAEGQAPRRGAALQAMIDAMYEGFWSLDRLSRVLYLATLALLPWGGLVRFPWLHENAQWSDVVFALATAAWAAGLLAARRLPRLRLVHAGLALYLGWAVVSLLAASPRPAAGPAQAPRRGHARGPPRRDLGPDGPAGNASGRPPHARHHPIPHRGRGGGRGILSPTAGSRRSWHLRRPAAGALSRAQAGFPHRTSSRAGVSSPRVPRPRGRWPLPCVAARGAGGPRGHRRADDLARHPGLRPRRRDPRSHDPGTPPLRQGARRRSRPRDARPHRLRPPSRRCGRGTCASCPAPPRASMRHHLARNPRRAPARGHRSRHLARPPRPPAVRRAPHPAERRGDAGPARARRPRPRCLRPLARAVGPPPHHLGHAGRPRHGRPRAGRRGLPPLAWRSASPTRAAGTKERATDVAEPAPGVDARRGPLRRVRRPRVRRPRRPAPRDPHREARRRA